MTTTAVQGTIASKAIRRTWTREELEATDWAKEFKENCPVSYEEGVRHALNPKLRVEIYRTDETGEMLWAISAVVDGEYTGFWMHAKRTKIAAVELCRSMGWKITG